MITLLTQMPGEPGPGHNTQRGALRFVDELLARVRRAAAAGQILVRADSGFWNKKVIARLRERGCRYSIGVTMQRHVTERIAQIADEVWQPVPGYPDTGVCELAETTLGDERLIVRRVHLHAQDDQTRLRGQARGRGGSSAAEGGGNARHPRARPAAAWGVAIGEGWGPLRARCFHVR